MDAGTGTWLQVSRSDWDCVILLAQARAAWKQGGAEFKASLELEKAALQDVLRKTQGCGRLGPSLM